MTVFYFMVFKLISSQPRSTKSAKKGKMWQENPTCTKKAPKTLNHKTKSLISNLLYGKIESRNFCFLSNTCTSATHTVKLRTATFAASSACYSKWTLNTFCSRGPTSTVWSSRIEVATIKKTRVAKKLSSKRY
jgi:hypothetical protein